MSDHTERPGDGAPSDVTPGEDFVGDERAPGGRPARGVALPVVALVAVIALGLGLLGGWGLFAPRHPGDHSVDAGFARDMSEHHAQAVQMSLLVMQRTDDESVRRLATDIATSQANQQGRMADWLREWGLPMARPAERMAWMAAHDHDAADLPAGVPMPGMATPQEIARLTAASGEAAEVLYLQLMTTHHISGVDMARAAAAGAAEPQVASLAQGMADAQGSEIALMKDMLEERGAQPREDVTPYLDATPGATPTSPGGHQH